MRVQLPKIGLGCMGFTHAYGEPMEEKLAVERIRAAYEMGYRFFDTAQRYTGIDHNGQIVYNETVVGEALKDVRQDVIIATKCGITMRDGQRIVDGRPETIRVTLQESLKRLKTDYVDIYYLHTPDPKVPMAVVAKTMKELYDKGLIRGWGVSQVNAEQLREANAVFEVSAVQNRYSMMARASLRKCWKQLLNSRFRSMPFHRWPMGIYPVLTKPVIPSWNREISAQECRNLRRRGLRPVRICWDIWKSWLWINKLPRHKSRWPGWKTCRSA